MKALAINPCAIIPVYNHPSKIWAVVDAIRQKGLPCVLVDDGSEPNCAAVLVNISHSDDAVYLLRMDENRGKGAAVCKGLKYAHELGFSHALQVDADGQHDLTDIPKFLTAASAAPQAVVSGCRRYQDMPPSRRSGRKLTDFWVCVNTVSKSIKDSMCGYRLYPLAETLVLLNRKRIGARMDFDTDILVRLYWQGLDVINIETNIRYQDDIPSHFDIVQDNVRITWMHTRLFFGMLPRFFSLWLRKAPHKRA